MKSAWALGAVLVTLVAFVSGEDDVEAWLNGAIGALPPHLD